MRQASPAVELAPKSRPGCPAKGSPHPRATCGSISFAACRCSSSSSTTFPRISCLFHAALDRLLRRGRGVHLHLGLYRGARLRREPQAQRRALATAQIYRRVWQLYVAHIFLFVIFTAEVSYTLIAVQNPMYTEEMGVGDF